MLDTPDDAPFLVHREVIESVIRFVCRRRGLRGDDAEEFAAEVRLRLVEDDSRVLRKYEGRAQIKTYLTVVITRSALDYQAARWGRWRPTMRARRAGPAAVRLEQLMVRDATARDDALAIVTREFAPIDRTALDAMAETLWPRVRRQQVGDDVLEDVPGKDPGAEDVLLYKEQTALFDRVWARLTELIAALPQSDQLVMQMRFEQGMKVVDIARLLGLDQKGLYRRIQDVLTDLRQLLERDGIDAATVRDLLGDA